MGRNAQYNNEQFINAALKILSAQGPAAVTIAAVAGEVGAPVGSVYHRFLSRDTLLAEVWLGVVTSFQEEFLRLLKAGDGLGAALFTPRWVRSHPQEARILLLYRQEELAGGSWPEELQERARRIRRDLENGIREHVAQIADGFREDAAARLMFAVIDVPYAAVIRHIRQGRKPPKRVDDYIQRTFAAIMGR